MMPHTPHVRQSNYLGRDVIIDYVLTVRTKNYLKQYIATKINKVLQNHALLCHALVRQSQGLLYPPLFTTSSDSCHQDLIFEQIVF